MPTPKVAREWARAQRNLLETAPPSLEEFCFEHANTVAWERVWELTSNRVDHMSQVSSQASSAIDRIWIEQGDGGFVTMRLYPVGDQFAVLTDSGFVNLLKLGSQLIARHYKDASFETEHCTPEQRQAFARINTTMVGQLFLHGRLVKEMPALNPKWGPVAERVLREALLFALAHELGHAIVFGQHVHGTVHWLSEAQVPSDLRDVAAEVEADGFAVAVVFSDLVDTTAGDSEVLLRLMALRLVLQVLESTERASLTESFERHLPAVRRWAGIRAYLGSVLPSWLLERFERLWDVVRRPLVITEARDLVPPLESPMIVGVAQGWLERAEDHERWLEIETQVWQFRLPTVILEVLIGADAAAFMGDRDLGRALELGRRAVEELLETLPSWVTGSGPRRRQAGSGELMRHLRFADRWPPPFRDGAPLPLHLMTAAVHRSLRGPLTQLNVV